MLPAHRQENPAMPAFPGPNPFPGIPHGDPVVEYGQFNGSEPITFGNVMQGSETRSFVIIDPPASQGGKPITFSVQLVDHTPATAQEISGISLHPEIFHLKPGQTEMFQVTLTAKYYGYLAGGDSGHIQIWLSHLPHPESNVSIPPIGHTE
jgi:hypothetical protein